MSDLPEMKPVTSSNVESVGHDGSALHVKFKNGGHYIYDECPADVHESLMGADSPGKFLAANVRGKYASRKYEAPNVCEYCGAVGDHSICIQDRSIPVISESALEELYNPQKREGDAG